MARGPGRGFVRREGIGRVSPGSTMGRGAPAAGTRSDAGESLLAYAPFERQATASFNACEWGQIRRSHDTTVGGRIINLRAAIACQTICVRPDSPITHPQAF